MNPCAIGPPYGLSALARSTSTWIHWWSPVASANRLTASWVTSCQSLVPSSWPTRPGSSAIVVVVLMPRSCQPAAERSHRPGRRRPDRSTRVGTAAGTSSPPPWCSGCSCTHCTSGQGKPVSVPAGCAGRVHWLRVHLHRRLDDVRARAPALGPSGRRRAVPPPRGRRRVRGPAPAPRIVVPPRRHLGHPGGRAARRGAGARGGAAGGPGGARAAVGRRRSRALLGRRPRRLVLHDGAGAAG